MTYTRWWHSLFLSVSVATWVLAQPFFSFIADNRTLLNIERSEDTGARGLLLIVLIFQVVPTAVVFLLDRAFIARGGERALRIYRAVVFLVAILVFLRTIHVNVYVPATFGVPLGLKLLVAFAAAAVIFGLLFRLQRHATLLFMYLAVASVGLTVAFFAQTGLTTAAWGSASPKPDPVHAAPQSGKDPVFILILDALGSHGLVADGRIDPERFPNFAQLAEDSAWFTNGTSNYYDSVFSIGSLMTGDRNRIEMPGVDDSVIGIPGFGPNHLFSLLAQAGYAIELYDGDQLCFNEGFVCRDPTNINRKSPDLFLKQVLYEFARSKFIPERLTRRFFALPFSADSHRLPLWNEFVAGVTAENAPGRV